LAEGWQPEVSGTGFVRAVVWATGADADRGRRRCL